MATALRGFWWPYVPLHSGLRHIHLLVSRCICVTQFAFQRYIQDSIYIQLAGEGGMKRPSCRFVWACVLRMGTILVPLSSPWPAVQSEPRHGFLLISQYT